MSTNKKILKASKRFLEIFGQVCKNLKDIDYNELTILEEKEDCVTFQFDGWINIIVEYQEYKHLNNETLNQIVFDISTIKVSRGGYMEPNDYEEIPYKIKSRDFDAVKSVIELYLQHKLNQEMIIVEETITDIEQEEFLEEEFKRLTGH